LIDIELMRGVIESSYTAQLTRHLGQAGPPAIKALLKEVTKIYLYISPESFTRLSIIVDIESINNTPQLEGGVSIRDIERLPSEITDNCIIKVLPSGDLILWKQNAEIHFILDNNTLCYEYNCGAESIRTNDLSLPIPKLIPGAPSMFSIPTFHTVNQAIDHYYIKLARQSRCGILTKAWKDQNRIFFIEKPEDTLQSSLYQYLYGSLRNTEVRREQNVDESHPIDIKVSWLSTNRQALIEIKWLGKSLKDDGNLTAPFLASRAVDGAQQLADYLDSNKLRTPSHITRGYLVVFDGRRWQTNASTKTINLKNGFHYRDEEITYAPPHHTTRHDFEEPIRLFLEPNVS
jgi:hypothetical protein